MKRITTMTDHIKNEAEVEEDNMKVKKNKSKEEFDKLNELLF